MKYLIVETRGKHEALFKVEAPSAPEALGKWLDDMATVYDLSRITEDGVSGIYKNSHPEWMIWAEGEHSADFGTHIVHVESYN
jgi:hypothetical protein